MDLERLKARAAEIAERKRKILLDRTPGVEGAPRAGREEHARRASPRTSRPATPTPSTSKRGKGSSVWDVDGTEYTDFHGGFGVNVVGHAHPKIVEALEKAADEAIHFAVTTETTVALAEEICAAVPARADAVRELRHRGHDGRDPRGARGHRPRQDHQDGGLLPRPPRLACCSPWCPRPTCSACATTCEHDGKAWYTTEPTSKGVPKALWDTVDRRAVQRRRRRSRRRSPTTRARSPRVILEPVMMNIGIVEPQPGYLQALRDACEKHGAVLIYDEVKCGGTIAYGGTTERYGVKPHLAAYAKAIGGGSTIGAFGGEARYMEWVTKGAAQQGTFNGNPLSSAAGLAALTRC